MDKEVLGPVIKVPYSVSKVALEQFFGVASDQISVFDRIAGLRSNIENGDFRSRLAVSVQLAVLSIKYLIDPNSVKTYSDVISAYGTDALTGISNRSKFIAAFEDEIHRDRSHALMMMDIMNFGFINQEHGHVVGDEGLQAFASALNSNFRTEGERATDAIGKARDEIISTAGRVGGDEFVVLLNDGTGLDTDTLPGIVLNKGAAVLLDSAIVTFMDSHNIAEFGVRIGSTMIGDDVETYDTAIALADCKTNTQWTLVVRRHQNEFVVYRCSDSADVMNIDKGIVSSGIVFEEQCMLAPIAKRIYQ